MKCRACGLEHSPMLRCEMAARLVKPVTHTEPDVTHTTEPVTHKRSNADKQRAYREAHKEEYKARNKARMAAKRAPK